MCGLLVQVGDDVLCPLEVSSRHERRERQGWAAAMEHIRRRGPDTAATWQSPHGRMRLGHARLAINDLSDAGAQPMLSDDSRTALVFNGEIYNAPTLRAELKAKGAQFNSHCDTEVLLKGYLAWGLDRLLERIVGMYAFVIWDHDKGELCGAVDPVGMKPLVYACSGGCFFAASDCDALSLILPDKPPLDGTGLSHVMCLGYCPAPWTVWKGISKLGPGTAFRWRVGDASPRTWRYWSPPTTEQSTDADFAELFESVVADHLLSDVPIGLLLSGGLDSSAIALALANAGHQTECVTLGLDSSDDESGSAQETAIALGHTHRAEQLRAEHLDDLIDRYAKAYDEPQGFGALLTATRVCEAARQSHKVMLAGDGGDEAFAGYTWHRSPPIVNQTPTTSASALAAAVSNPSADGATRTAAMDSLSQVSFMHAYLQSVMPRFHPAEASALLRPIDAEYDIERYAAWALAFDNDKLPWPRRAQQIDLGTFCAGSILPKMDRASMAVGLELRMPFLDRRLIEWAFTQPPSTAQHKAQSSKPAIRTYLRNRVPEGVLSRPKQGFSLRLGGPTLWIDRLAAMTETKFFQNILVEDWATFVAEGVPNRTGRAHMLCMIAQWAEDRI